MLRFIIFLSLSWFSYYHLNLAMGVKDDDPLTVSMLQATFLLIFYLLVKIQCIYWRKLKNTGFVLNIFEHLVYPAMCLIFPLITFKHLYNFNQSFNVGAVFVFSLIVVFMISADRKLVLHNLILDDGYLDKLEEQNGSYFFLRFPPKERMDLLPLDFIIVSMPFGLSLILSA